MSGEATELTTTPISYRLGLDIGANSVGWAALRLSDESADAGRVQGLLAAGVRIFEAGVEGSIEQGKDGSRAVARRLARQQRRQTWRRQFRKRQLFVLLQRHGLLPEAEDSSSAGRDAVLKPLDQELTGRWCSAGDLESHQKLPYLLRAAAAERILEPFELGRAIYHLGQRRGYKANRRTPEGDDEQQGAVSGGISLLDQARLRDPADPASLRTLAQTVVEEFRFSGGHFAIRSEAAESSRRGRVRGHYTSRQMYIQEFEAIRNFQLANGGPLSAKTWTLLEKVLFRQRPLKSQSHLVGRCTLEKDRFGRGRRRSLMALSDFQEFRLLQSLNHLMIVQDDRTEKPLMPGQKEILYDHLMREGDLKLRTRAARGKTAAASVISLLGLAKNTQFSLRSPEESEEDDVRLIGHRTNAKIRAVLGGEWDDMAESQQEKLILQLVYAADPERLSLWLTLHFGFNEPLARQVAGITLEEQHASLSRRAIRRLLPRLRAGESYAAARQAVYPDSLRATAAAEKLPPVTTWNREINNPAVIRALTEVRRVVNSLIQRFGKPAAIHVELARDLKRSRKERTQLWKQNEDNQKLRDRAKVEIVEQLGYSSPSRADVEKWLLAEECNWQCPYTGRPISAATLKHFDVEHIYPRQYLDDSFGNKTLSDPEFNRARKRNRLPSEVLEGAEWADVLTRVRHFKGRFAEAKLRRFQAESVPEDFVSRQLNDTRYNSRLAAQFVSLLYGGRNDADRQQRIVTPTGGLTWLIRRGFGLDRILSDGDYKERSDHRQHAVDAICVALSSQKVIQRLSGLAEQVSQSSQRFNAFLSEFAKELPWPTFHEDAVQAIQGIIVSHRPQRAIGGPLHAETYYSKPLPAPAPVESDGARGKGGRSKVTEHRVRKSIDSLKKKDIEGDAIVDLAVRAAVQRKYAELASAAGSASAADPKKLWGNRADTRRFPRLPPSRAKSGRSGEAGGSIIFKVRVRTSVNAKTVGKGVTQRYVAAGVDANFAAMVYEIASADGRSLRWVHEVVTRLDAHQKLVERRRLLRESSSKGEALGAIGQTVSESFGELILLPRTRDDFATMSNPPFAVKADDSIRFVCAFRKNDLLELDVSDGRLIYRVQNFSTGEIQLCEHFRQIVDKKDRNTSNRITATDALRRRRLRVVHVTPSGEIRNVETLQH